MYTMDRKRDWGTSEPAYLDHLYPAKRFLTQPSPLPHTLKINNPLNAARLNSHDVSGNFWDADTERLSVSGHASSGQHNSAWDSKLNNFNKYPSGHVEFGIMSSPSTPSALELFQGPASALACAPTEAIESNPGEVKECYGMICGAVVRLQNSQAMPTQTDHFIHISSKKGRILRFQLCFNDRGCWIVSNDFQGIGTLTTKTSHVLGDLHRDQSVTCDCLMAFSDLTNDSKSSGDKGSSRTVEVDINVYGKGDVADVVAMELSKNGIFLQDPYWKPMDLKYHNPQYLDIPTFPFDSPDEHREALQDSGNGVEVMSSFLDEKNSSIDFDKMLDSLACHNDLVHASADARIATPLLSHQKEGLDFISRREMLSDPSRSFWRQLDDTEEGEHVYQHIITGARSLSPTSSRGGIIADEMGLGKSLTMLSAIVGSLNDALSYACSATAVASETCQRVVAAKSTLLIVPSALLIDNWIEEINKHTHTGTLTYYKYHGFSRKIGYPLLLQNDIILTTYATLAAESNRNGSLLHQISWYRVVLDEAHVTRNASTKQFKAISSLTAQSRWCLTGTPIQNTLEDLGSLVRFLKEPILEEPAQFRRYITKKIQPTKATSVKDLENLRILISSICLRRNKAILHFPPSQEHTYDLEFSPTERMDYERLESDCRQAIEMAVSGHKTKEAHQTVLEVILRLRLFCNNGVFHRRPGRDCGFPSEPEDIGSLLQQRDEAICYYCSCDINSFSGFGNPQIGIFTQASQAVCGECVAKYKATNNELHAAEVNMTDEESNYPRIYPTKIMTLCYDIEMHVNESKSIVFSYWKKTLDIVGNIFKDRQIPYLRVDGSMKLSDRKHALNQFQQNNNAPVLLMTLGTGAVGLNNLCVASRIHILEPQWNPSVESQAIGRVLRLGQKNAVQVVRYVMKGTVEKNVQNRQIQKLQLCKDGFNSKNLQHAQQRAQMLKDLICPT